MKTVGDRLKEIQALLTNEGADGKASVALPSPSLKPKADEIEKVKGMVEKAIFGKLCDSAVVYSPVKAFREDRRRPRSPAKPRRHGLRKSFPGGGCRRAWIRLERAPRSDRDRSRGSHRTCASSGKEKEHRIRARALAAFSADAKRELTVGSRAGRIRKTSEEVIRET